MTLGAHLIELRNRLIIAAAAIVVGLGVGFFLTTWVWDMLRAPLEQLEIDGRTAEITYTDIGSGFDLRVQIALFIGVIIASPVWLWQIWRFFAPGMKRREKRFAILFLMIAVPLFLAGVWVAWMVMPNIVRVMSTFQPSVDSFQLNARSYLDFALKLMLAVGIGFILPLVLVMLNLLGVLRGASILKSWRIALLAILAFAGIATPAAEITTMLLLSVPLVALFLLAAGVALLNDRRVDRKRAAELAEYGLSDSDEEVPESEPQR